MGLYPKFLIHGGIKNMRKNLGAKGVGIPEPVYIVGTYDASGKPNAFNVAWGGQCGPKHFAMNISSHKSTENLKLKKAFTLSFATKSQVTACDFVGIVSQNNDPEKMAKTGWTFTKAENVDAPIINELPLALECKVIEIAQTSIGELRVVGEVVNVSVDESILTDGSIDADKAEFIAFDPSAPAYREVGSKVAKAFGEGAKLK